jgi:hypothetical protein
MTYTIILILLAVGLLAIPIIRNLNAMRASNATLNQQVVVAQLIAYVPVAVATVAQLYKNTKTPTDPIAKQHFNEERKKYAISLISSYAKVLNVPIDDELLTTISATIEAEVYNLSTKVDKIINV